MTLKNLILLFLAYGWRIVVSFFIPVYWYQNYLKFDSNGFAYHRITIRKNPGSYFRGTYWQRKNLFEK
jgi:hypothetical protein